MATQQPPSVEGKPPVGRCPVNHGAAGSEASKKAAEQWSVMAQQQQQPQSQSQPQATTGSSTTKTTEPVSLKKGCPVLHSHTEEFPSVDELLDVRNNMPPPNQLPSPDQKTPLSTERKVSTIPRAGSAPVTTDEVKNQNWVYPSPQMFYNAMKRKNHNPREEDMDVVVSIHNEVNERAWKEILAYESFHASECCNPQLLRFRGRPDEPTIKARFNKLLGYTPPFDRHDWVVDRCGKEVTYIIDFYQGALPTSVFLDVRPAPTPSGMLDRFRKAMYDYFLTPPTSKR